MDRSARLVLLLGLVCALSVVVLSVLALRGGESPASSHSDGAASSSAASSAAVPAEGLTVLCPNLGKADSFLLLSGSGALLIDTGEDAAPVLALLEEQGVRSLDALVLSHFDKDHIGGAAAVLERVSVKTLYRTAFEEDSEPYAALMGALERSDTEVVTVTDTLRVTAAGTTLTLWPPLEAAYEKDEDNNASLIASVEAEDTALLFTGDALKPRIQEFLDRQYDGTAYQFLKVPHHGRETKPTALLLDAFHPQYALITSSYAEPESEKLLRRLEKQEVEALLTRQGAVTLRCRNGKVEIVS